MISIKLYDDIIINMKLSKETDNKNKTNYIMTSVVVNGCQKEFKEEVYLTIYHNLIYRINYSFISPFYMSNGEKMIVDFVVDRNSIIFRKKLLEVVDIIYKTQNTDFNNEILKNYILTQKNIKIPLPHLLYLNDNFTTREEKYDYNQLYNNFHLSLTKLIKISKGVKVMFRNSDGLIRIHGYDWWISPIYEIFRILDHLRLLDNLVNKIEKECLQNT